MLRTSQYALGGIVRQDPYPEGLKSGVYARHQQHDWSFQVPVDTGIRIFTHHPGTTVQHGYWTGDMNCGCTDGFLHGTAHIATFRIPQGQKHHFIHACIPRHKFDEVIEKDGWIFARKRKAYAALHLPGGWEWTREGEWKDREVISHGLRKASVFEAGSEEEAGSFEDFRREISANKIEFDPDSMRLRYVSKRSGTLELTGDGTRLLDGAEPDLDFPTYDSPYLQSPSGSQRQSC